MHKTFRRALPFHLSMFSRRSCPFDGAPWKMTGENCSILNCLGDIRLGDLLASSYREILVCSMRLTQLVSISVESTLPVLNVD